MNVLLGLLLLLSLQALNLKIFQILWVSSSVLIEDHIKNRFGRPIFFHELHVAKRLALEVMLVDGVCCVVNVVVGVAAVVNVASV